VVYPEGEYTMLRVIGALDDPEGTPAPLRLGGRLTMHALDDIPPLLRPSLLGIQRHLTLTLSAMGRNTTAAGFVERVMLNAQRPLDDEGNPLPYRAGAGMVNWLVGVQTEAGVTTPAMHVREPQSPAAFTETADALTFHGHKEARQLHALLAGDAAPSGRAAARPPPTSWRASVRRRAAWSGRCAGCSRPSTPAPSTCAAWPRPTTCAPW
jgi:hypothetical protein